jgi:hypothetical protein
MDKEFLVMVKETPNTYLNLAPVRLAGALLVNNLPAIDHLPRIVVCALTQLQ